MKYSLKFSPSNNEKKKKGKLLIVHIHSILMNQTLKSPAIAKNITPSQFYRCY